MKVQSRFLAGSPVRIRPALPMQSCRLFAGNMILIWIHLFRTTRKKVHDVLIYGTNGKEVKVYYKGQRGEGVYDVAFDGLIKNVERRYRETGSETMKAEYETFMNITPCSACGGQRLKASALAVTIGGKKYFRGHSPFYREASEISSGTAFDGDAADDRWSDPERDPCKDSVFRWM